MSTSMTAFAPATIANVGPGFDILGCAIAGVGDTVTASFSGKDEVSLEIIGPAAVTEKLPHIPEENCASFAVISLLQRLNETRGVHVVLHKNMPLGSGLGSSASSSVAALVAVNALLGSPCTKDDLLPLAMASESLACGAPHADNVAPSLFGGFVGILPETNRVVQLGAPRSLWVTVVHPHVQVRTADARRVVPPRIPLAQAITQWGRVMGLTAGILQDDISLIAESLQDIIIEPARSVLVPQFHAVKEAVLRHGALGCSLSGSGPSVFALSENQATAHSLADVMQKVWRVAGITSTAYVSQVSGQGAHLISHQPAL